MRRRSWFHDECVPLNFPEKSGVRAGLAIRLRLTSARQARKKIINPENCSSGHESALISRTADIDEPTYVGCYIGLNDFAPLEQVCYAFIVTAATALDKQIERYRQMTGEQRLAIALELHEMSCDIAREGIRRQHPDADAAEVERLLRHRLELARAA